MSETNIVSPLRQGMIEDMTRVSQSSQPYGLRAPARHFYGIGCFDHRGCARARDHRFGISAHRCRLRVQRTNPLSREGLVARSGDWVYRSNYLIVRR